MPPDYRARLAGVRGAIEAQLEALSRDFDRLDKAIPERRKNLLLLSNRDEVRQGTVEAAPYRVEDLASRFCVEKPKEQPGEKAAKRLTPREEFAKLVRARLEPNLARLREA